MSSKNNNQKSIKLFEMFSDLIFYPENYSENDICEMVDFYIDLGFIIKIWDEKNNNHNYEITSDGHLAILILLDIEKSKTDSELLECRKEFPDCCWCKNLDIRIDEITKDDENLMCEYHHLLSRKTKLRLMRND